MRCISCERLSWYIICKKCQNNLLQASFYTRTLENNFKVHNFYPYEEIKSLISCKYEFFGDKVFNILAKNSFTEFSKRFNYPNNVYVIPIDDHTRHDFSHTAILAKSLKSNIFKPLYNTLKAQNIVKYAGKNLKFRQNHKRDFKYSGPSNIQVILVDDLITTGQTITQAKLCLEKYGCEVLFALTLSDARV
jgi:competence protein ComFC